MANESPYSFDDLVEYRQQLRKFCSSHYNSLTKFKSGISFKLNNDEGDLQGRARHLSSTATCIESLLDCPVSQMQSKEDARKFALAAIRKPAREWQSDESADIYCRCRTLPLVVDHLQKHQRVIERHLKEILLQLKENISRFAIGEALGKEQDNWYPPNAYHTYWALYLIEAIEKNYSEAQFSQLRENFSIEQARTGMLLWAQKTAGYQISLHTSESSTLDSDQLAWALAILTTFESDFQANLAQQDFIRFGLKCLFEHQTNTGIWRTGAPLFHYKKSGNAYCYIFETFTVLLKSALTDQNKGRFLRQELRPYMQQLLKLWSYAKSTQIPLRENEEVFGWSSGHRPNRKKPESWATASVYSFSQCLRRLMGIWVRETANEQLRVSTERTSKEDAVKKISERGDTWVTSGKATTADQLMAFFVNPAERFGSEDSLEPDSQVICENQARAAILFGPPGTSKTTLSSNIAKAIGWNYVELHASHFVAEGLPDVQRTANVIFEKLLQLDRTVILFDEIDELVRTRDKDGDAFGRFLTTSMLPKLAELWKLRKVIYFIATNHVEFFDPAITRAQRFDALIHVSPPSFSRKIEQITELLKKRSIRISGCDFTDKNIEKALRDIPSEISHEKPLPESCILAKFLLMRWDQLEELACIIKKRHSGPRMRLNCKIMEEALSKLSDPLLSTCGPFIEYLKSEKYEQHDYSKISLWEVRNVTAKMKSKLDFSCDKYWYTSLLDFNDFSNFPGKYTVVKPGIIKCR